MKQHAWGILAGCAYLVCNYVIGHLPCWHLRKLLYSLMGMEIGSGSRIMMCCTVTHPWNIRIGENTTINESCYLDGRGGLKIGSNVNISLQSMLITGTHDHKSLTFDYYTEPITVKNGVWLGARSMILNGCYIGDNSIVSAGSVLSPRSTVEPNTIVSGSPAKVVKRRKLDGDLLLKRWNIHFR